MFIISKLEVTHSSHNGVVVISLVAAAVDIVSGTAVGIRPDGCRVILLFPNMLQHLSHRLSWTSLGSGFRVEKL